MRTKYKIFIHLAFWVYMANQTLMNILLMKDQGYEPFSEYTIYPVTSLITFYAIYCTLGLFFRSKNKALPVVLLIVVAVALVPFRIGLEYLFWKYIAYMKVAKEVKLELSTHWWFSSGRLVLIYGIYALLIRLAVGWYESQKLKSALLLEKQAGELALLRSQVNPHFLFNTLNNIYSLVYQKSDDAPQAVMKMSAIMRYVLYDANTDQVPLEKEIEYLNSFIELEKLRIRHQDFVEMTVEGVAEGRTIAPMLLIPFVENAFKHGSKSSGTPGIRIRLQIAGDEIGFVVENRVKPSGQMKDPAAGIGLSNVRRRLNLLYPGRHHLDIIANQDFYRVTLNIKT